MRTARILAAALAAIAVAVVLAAPGSAEGTKIFGTVGPGFEIALKDAQGNAITKLEPGQYELVVDDKSEFHNFRLTGPGVSVATTVEEIGQKTFQITIADGKYTFVCDPHAGSMVACSGSVSELARRHPCPTTPVFLIHGRVPKRGVHLTVALPGGI